MLATIMQTLDNAAVPTSPCPTCRALIRRKIRSPWVLTAYIVASAIATPLSPVGCETAGQKNIFLASIRIHGGLRAVRHVQLLAEIDGIYGSVFGAPWCPSPRWCSWRSIRRKQGSAMAVWGIGVMVGPILGPTLGGWLTDSYNWRWVFFINVPIGVIAFYGMWKYIRPDAGGRHARFDVFGFSTLSLAIGSLQLLLDRGQQNDWFSSTETWIEAVVAAIAATYWQLML